MKLEHILFAICVVALFVYSVFETRQNRAIQQSFIDQWATIMIGQVTRTDPVGSDAGIIYINIDTIIGNKYDVSTYQGGPFYLLTSNKKAKLFEGGMNLIKNGDLVVIDDSGNFLVTRNGDEIIRRPVAFRGFKPIWAKVNQEVVKSYWGW